MRPALPLRSPKIDVRRFPDLWRRSDVTVRDFPLALLLIAATVVPGLKGNGTRLDTLPDRPFDALTVGVIAFEALPLAVRRRWPAVCLALVSIGFAVDQLRGYHTAAATALPIALISAGAHLRLHRRAVAVLASVGYLALAIALAQRGSGETVTESAGGAVRQMETDRRAGMQSLAEHLDRDGELREGLTVEEAVDALWVLTSFESLDLLVTGRGLTVDEAIGHPGGHGRASGVRNVRRPCCPQPGRLTAEGPLVSRGGSASVRRLATSPAGPIRTDRLTRVSGELT